jgi:hypothetical protein
MALLQSGFDIAVIALWLGHESIETTKAYLHANLAIKEKHWQRSCRWACHSGASKRTILCLLSWSRYEPRLPGRIKMRPHFA